MELVRLVQLHSHSLDIMISRKNFGFTLIEIILSVGILAIITGSSYVALIQFSRSQGLNSEYLRFKNILNLAKSNASSQILNCTSNQTLVGYRVSPLTNSSYTIDEVCRGGNGQLLYRSTRTPELSTGLTISNFQPILFLVISGEVKNLSSEGIILDLPSDGVEITLSDKGGKTMRVRIFPNGRIE